VQDMDFAPLLRVEDSPSYVVSLGPEDAVPAATFGTQFTLFFMLAVVPESVKGNQTYVDRIRLLLTQRSPIYTALSPSGNMKFVCEVYVFEPESAKPFQADQGPAMLVAVL
jgi:hypothetical protein